MNAVLHTQIQQASPSNKTHLVAAEHCEAALGADLFIDGTAHPAVKVVLANLNPFSLWYYSLLTIGIGTACNLSRARSAGVVGTFWVLAMGFGAGIAWVAAALESPASSF